jgi:release factor glutamine methyltransferase
LIIATALKEATSLLEKSVPRARFEAELLLAYHLGVDRVFLVKKDDEQVNDIQGYFHLVKRRAQSEPYEYIVNKVSFYDIELYVDNRVLIPRPETELLIDEASKIIVQNNITKIAEIGVGSGAISIVLARAFPKLKIVATDISSDALNVAVINRDNFALDNNIEFICTNILDGIEDDFDMIISNPPYIANDFILESNVVDFEPHNALFGGRAGHELLEDIIMHSKDMKVRFLACEMGYDQKDIIEQIFIQIGVKYYHFYKDLAGFDRGFIVQFKE